ncbi:hypothetical protein LINPERPRIM_LOCUS41194 [Linum perenne]
MLLSQAIEIAIGCLVAPLTFFLFYKAFDVGNLDGEYKALHTLIKKHSDPMSGRVFSTSITLPAILIVLQIHWVCNGD